MKCPEAVEEGFAKAGSHVRAGVLTSLIGIALCAMSPAIGQAPMQEQQGVPVTIDNFVRAATDLEFETYASLAGGVNRFFHFKEPTPIDNQPTIRMNRDTLYSAAVVDISDGAALTLPDVGAVNAIQDGFRIDAASSIPFQRPGYDLESLDGLRSAAIEVGRFTTDSTRIFGPAGHVEPLRHFLGTAVGFGGLPEEEAFCLNVDPGLPVGACRIEVPADVPVGALWSVSLYNADGFFERNARDSYGINSVSGTPYDDGSVTVHFCGCEDGRVNGLPVLEGWSYAERLHQP
ncbi:MAG: DUF1214 domain-containing protein [Pseudomonadota bacterium]